jgi:hypothetical protein
MRLVLLVTIAVLATACARIVVPQPTPLDAKRSEARWPGITVTDLARGRELYVARCSSCHQPVLPSRISPEAWPGHVAEMSERAHLSGEERRLVEAYVVAMASRP